MTTITREMMQESSEGSTLHLSIWTLMKKTGSWWDWVAILLTLWPTVTAATPQAQPPNLLWAATPIFFPRRLPGKKNKYGDLFRRRAGFWPDRLSSAPLLPHL